jgi:hypothetical protein
MIATAAEAITAINIKYNGISFLKKFNTGMELMQGKS